MSINRYYAITDLEKTIKLMAPRFGMPELLQSLSIYSVCGNHQLYMKIEQKKIFYSISKLGDPLPDYSVLRMNNFKVWLRSMAILGFNKAKIGRIHLLRFRCEGVNIDILMDSFIGNVVRTTKALPDDLIGSTNLQILSSSAKEKKIELANASVDPEVVLDELDVVHPVIYDYCMQNGIDIAVDTRTIRSAISQKSNDYSISEMYFEKVTGSSLLSRTLSPIKYSIMSHSIVICAYNSELYIQRVLEAINAQRLSDGEFGKIEVIVVDDGSSSPVEEFLIRGMEYKYSLQIIRLTKNMGLAKARNIGLSSCSGEYITFIDSDIVISPNFVREMNMRISFKRDAVYVAMRKNVNSSTFEISDATDFCDSFDDSRVKNIRRKSQVGWDNKLPSDYTTNLLADTRYFKNLGLGMELGIYSIANTISGHNISAHKSIFKLADGFSTEFKGWGFEDTYFAAKSFALGAQIIPVLNVAAYHFDYGPRNGDMKTKIREAKLNKSTYERLLSEQL